MRPLDLLPPAAVALALLALAGCKRPAAPAPPTDPASLPMKYKDHNVVFVSFDALQAAHVSALGYPLATTPALDALAARSFSFTHAYSVASWTVPASMTWFTGVFPSEHRMTNKFAVYNAKTKRPARLGELAPHLVTLASVLHKNGYATGGFTGNAGVSGGFGYEDGFHVYYNEPGRFGGMSESMPRALRWLRANRGRKFFLFLHGYDVHGQHVPAGGYDHRFVEPGYDRRYTGSDLEQEVLREEGLGKGRVALRESDVRFWRALYDEKINRLDAHFAQFLREFDQLGLTERTLFVLTSDHGTELHEHGRFDHGFTLYDEMIHVPLFVRLPGQGGGKAVADRVSSIDVMPTVLDLIDADVPEAVRGQMRGRSLVPAMRGEHTPRDVFSETDYREYTYKRSVIAPDGWKLVYTMESKARELYDLKADPHERRDRAAEQPGRADELQRRLFAHFAGIGHDLTKREWKVGLNPVYPSQEK